ncbi:MAG TPA: class I SAM-dependent methyltransferase [Planctomycetota bacterium]|nr:class I SAM-dependent methyltransferase [Planctomycetota bacterium]
MIEALETYFRLMYMNGGVQVYRTAMGAGIPQALTAGPATVAEIAAKCGLKPGPAQLVIDALAALGLVQEAGGKYSLAPVASFLLGSYRDLGDAYWNHLPKLLATGEPLVAVEQATQGEAFYVAQAAALEFMVAPAAEVASAILARRAPKQVLDVGAGSAAWSLAVARRDPAVRVTAIDRPGVLKVAAASASRQGLADRFTPLPGDFSTVELMEEGFDLAIVANVAHLLSPEGNVSLFRRIHKALKPGGAVAVIDVVPGSTNGDLPRALYALGLALRTKTGRTYAREELDRCLSEAGYESAAWTSLEVVPHTLGMAVAPK